MWIATFFASWRFIKVASRAYVLENGRMVIEGTGEALLADDRVRKAYLGL